METNYLKIRLKNFDEAAQELPPAGTMIPVETARKLVDVASDVICGALAISADRMKQAQDVYAAGNALKLENEAMRFELDRLGFFTAESAPTTAFSTEVH